jgi:hypothetical protein
MAAPDAPGISRWSAAKSSSVRTSIRAGMCAVPINRESLSGDIVV